MQHSVKASFTHIADVRLLLSSYNNRILKTQISKYGNGWIDENGVKYSAKGISADFKKMLLLNTIKPLF